MPPGERERCRTRRGIGISVYGKLSISRSSGTCTRTRASTRARRQRSGCARSRGRGLRTRGTCRRPAPRRDATGRTRARSGRRTRSAGAADGPTPTERVATPGAVGFVDAAHGWRRVGHRRSERRERRGYAPRGRCWLLVAQRVRDRGSGDGIVNKARWCLLRLRRSQRGSGRGRLGFGWRLGRLLGTSCGSCWGAVSSASRPGSWSGWGLCLRRRGSIRCGR